MQVASTISNDIIATTNVTRAQVGWSFKVLSVKAHSKIHTRISQRSYLGELDFYNIMTVDIELSGMKFLVVICTGYALVHKAVSWNC